MGSTGTRLEPRRQQIFDLGFPVAALIIAALYAVFQFTPSSYALALQMIGVNDAGPLLGFAQLERSDEWALWTPYVQIAVNNGFARIEHISPTSPTCAISTRCRCGTGDSSSSRRCGRFS